MRRERTRKTHTLSSDRTEKEMRKPPVTARLTLLESGTSMRKSAEKHGDARSVCQTVAHFGNQRFVSDLGVGRRHVPPRKLQRRAYAAETGSDARTRGERQASVFMPGSVTSARAARNHLAT